MLSGDLNHYNRTAFFLQTCLNVGFVFRCVSLQELMLTENFLVELPNSIGNCIHLTNLNVDRNNLREIPREIGKISTSRVACLVVRRNCSFLVFFCVGNLKQLGVLSLRGNKLRSLPSEIGDCSQLHVLDVSGNQ